MGITGSGVATCVVRVYMAGLLLAGLALALKRQKLRISWALFRPNVTLLKLLTRIGWPSAIENLTDLGFCTWMSIVCTRLGTTYLAARQVVLDLDAFVYMVPLGLSYATVARVGQSFGANEDRPSLLMPAIRCSANASLILGMGYIAVASLLFAGFPRFVGRVILKRLCGDRGCRAHLRYLWHASVG